MFCHLDFRPDETGEVGAEIKYSEFVGSELERPALFQWLRMFFNRGNFHFLQVDRRVHRQFRFLESAQLGSDIHHRPVLPVICPLDTRLHGPESRRRYRHPQGKLRIRHPSCHQPLNSRPLQLKTFLLPSALCLLPFLLPCVLIHFRKRPLKRVPWHLLNPVGHFSCLKVIRFRRGCCQHPAD